MSLVELMHACEKKSPKAIAKAVHAVRKEAGPFFDASGNALRQSLFVLEKVFTQTVLPQRNPDLMVAFLEASGVASGAEGMLFQSEFTKASRKGDHLIVKTMLPHLHPSSWDFHNPLVEALRRYDIELLDWLLERVPATVYGRESICKAWQYVALTPDLAVITRVHAALSETERQNACVVGLPPREALRKGTPLSNPELAIVLLPFVGDLHRQGDLLAQRQDWSTLDQLALIAPSELAQAWFQAHGDHLPALAHRTIAQARQGKLEARPARCLPPQQPPAIVIAGWRRCNAHTRLTPSAHPIVYPFACRRTTHDAARFSCPPTGPTRPSA